MRPVPAFAADDAQAELLREIAATTFNPMWVEGFDTQLGPSDILAPRPAGSHRHAYALEWGDRIGPKRVLFILERLFAFYQEPRYRPSPWLKRRVMLDLPLSAPEGKTR